MNSPDTVLEHAGHAAPANEEASPVVLFQSTRLQLRRLPAGMLELELDRSDAPVNKLDNGTLQELSAALARVEQATDARGLLLSSGKEVFIVGADITEFSSVFAKEEAEIVTFTLQANQLFDRLAALPVPSVAMINGFALGGGLETALATDYRVMADTALVGLPEVTLGLVPGYGGTVRLARVAGAGTAPEWIVDGAPRKAAQALAAGVVDAVANAGQLRALALDWLQRAAEGELDWQAARAIKRGPVQNPADEATLAQARSQARRLSPPHQPARLIAVELIADASDKDHAQALALESRAFAQVSKTQAAASLVRIFLNDQAVKKVGRSLSRSTRPIAQAAVLGAGIMGGGIAFTSARRGTPVLLKDIRESALTQGLDEARKLLTRQVTAGRLDEEKAAKILASITPQLDYSRFDQADVVIEAVVEDLAIKHTVLAQTEAQLRDDAVLLSNTSSLRIDDLAMALQRPENFAGMHFFNPVPVMPLVEIIRGQRTSDAAIGVAVAQAQAMGKTPIVVRDCPGFLVNRILAAYIRAFLQLVADGADFQQVDRVAEAFGWPMGPAYLEDVVGLDTGAHVCDVIFAGYPGRMDPVQGNAIKALLAAGRLGQKNGKGFYAYEAGEGGKPRKSADPQAQQIIDAVRGTSARPFRDEEIIERLMLPLVFEAAIALEEGVVDSAALLDTALLLGIGFPAWLGGALAYADWLGAAHLVERSNALASLGPAYAAPDSIRRQAADGSRFYPA